MHGGAASAQTGRGSAEHTGCRCHPGARFHVRTLALHVHVSQEDRKLNRVKSH